jgi:hypothetical protein
MIAKSLDLMRGGNKRFQKTAAYGHFGRDDADFTWEQARCGPRGCEGGAATARAEARLLARCCGMPRRAVLCHAFSSHGPVHAPSLIPSLCAPLPLLVRRR